MALSSNYPKTILIIPAGSFQLPAIQTAQAMGLRVIALDGNPHAPGLKAADFGHAVEPRHVSEALACVARYAVDGVVSVASDPCVVAAADMAATLGTPGLSPESARRARNKLLSRIYLQERLPLYLPAFHPVSGVESLRQAARKIGFPFVLKPVESNGSKGVVIVDEDAELDMVFNYVSRFVQPVYCGDTPPMIAEEFLDGPEVSVEGLVIGNVPHVAAITDKRTTPPPFCVEIGHVIPSRLSEHMQEELRLAVLRIAAALGISNCGIHAELRLTQDGVKLVELGARLGGGCIASHLVPLATGVNMLEAVIAIALGNTPIITPQHSRAAAIRFLTPGPGQVIAIDGIEQARAVSGVEEVQCSLRVGDTITSFEHSDHRVGYVIASGASAEDAEIRAQQAVDCIHIDCR